MSPHTTNDPLRKEALSFTVETSGSFAQASEVRQQSGGAPRSGVFDTTFLRHVVLATAFKPEPFKRIQAALVAMALTNQCFTAADLPDEVTGGDKHLPGLATGGLLAAGLLTCVGRVRSPNKDAHGRKVDLLRATSTELCRTWLKRQGVDPDGIEDACRPALKLEMA